MPRGLQIVAGIAALAALGLLAISAGISFRFGSSFGRTEFDGQLYGGASALGDVLKAVAVFLVASAVKRRRWGQAIAGLMVCGTCAAFSFTSATGFGITSRTFASDATTLQAGLNRNALAALQSGQDELNRIRATLGSGSLRPADRRDLEVRETALSHETSDLRSRLSLAPSILTPNTQADALALLFGVEPSRMTNGLVVLLAALLELGSGLGMFVALGAFGGDQMIRVTASMSRPRAQYQLHTALSSRLPDRRNVVQLPAHGEASPLITGFLNLHTRRGEGSCSEAGELYRSFARYCQARRVLIPSQRRFGEDLAQRGYPKDRRAAGGRVRYLGIELVTVQAAAA